MMMMMTTAMMIMMTININMMVRLKGEGLRRNSSGITSASTSIMRMRLSTDYESVYSKVKMMVMLTKIKIFLNLPHQVEEAKKKSREESYKNVKLNLQSHDDSAA